MSKTAKISKTVLLLGLLTSVATLTACGKKEATTTTASSSVTKTSQSSSKEKVTTSPATEATSEATEAETATSETASSTATTSTFNLDAIVAGDFSSIAGTWANANGKTVVIEGDKLIFETEGESDPNQYNLIESQNLHEEGRVGASIGFYNNGERQGGIVLSIVPAGVPNILGEVSDQDHLEMGHMPTTADSGEHFFRQ
ncbi:DUF6287 domain-containing protein [Streptococcus entericus]|uniref:DUF6287 domain-containing protein n=1 Tax=Streptococcus entericus TaxID=155680 RepID=UPI00038285CB|nr:DUF6287 domain-containing protein [Streptococcus entericus]